MPRTPVQFSPPLRASRNGTTERMVRFAYTIVVSGLTAASLCPADARAAGDALAIVSGLAPGDLLNVRAAASPLGHTKTRLPNGSAVKNFGCGEFGGYQWCKVELADQPDVGGWVPGRYLLAVDTEGTATAAMPSLDDTATEAASADATASTGKADTTARAAPPDLSARFGDPPSTDAGRKDAASASLTAAGIEAYRLAFAGKAQAAANARQDAAGESEPPSPDSLPAGAGEPAIGDAVDEERETGAAAAVPLPSPRPDPTAEEPLAKQAEAPATGAPAPQIVARVDPQNPAPQWDATGEIPCARYVGQPMTRCRAGVSRSGAGKADVTVTWPDGGTRVIGFYDGKPAGANARGEFRFTHEGGLNMIRVGVSERFEITDALAFGD